MKNIKTKETKKRQSLAYSNDHEKKKKRKRKRNIPCLSEEVAFNILTWVPAVLLHNVIRLVCKSWARIIASRHLVTTHLTRSEFTFLWYRSRSDNFNSRFFELRRGIFREWELKRNKSSGVIMDCRLGLILFYEDLNLHLINPITKQNLRLPKIHEYSYRASFAKIAYVERTSEIKIVCVYEKTIDTSDWRILTIGNDMSWKMLNHSILHNSIRILELFSVGSFIICDLNHNDRFWSVDLDDESIHLTRGPILLDKSIYKKPLRELIIPMERDLYVLSRHLLPVELVIWKLKDFRRGGEWVEVFRTKDVNTELWKGAYVTKYNAWFQNCKILIYYSKFSRGPASFVAYDFIQRSYCNLLMNDYIKYECDLWIYTSSLVSF